MTNNIVANAKSIATEAHSGQFRKYDGQPYIVHPTRVVELLSKKTDNPVIIAAAWAHDVLEDTNYSRVKMLELIGPQAYLLVLELTNPSKDLKGAPRATRKLIDRMHLANVSIEAKLIKLCDRLDNVLDLATSNAEPDFKKLYKAETEALMPVFQFENIDVEYQDLLAKALKDL